MKIDTFMLNITRTFNEISGIIINYFSYFIKNICIKLKVVSSMLFLNNLYNLIL